MSDIAAYASLIGIAVALIGAWWRMDHFRDLLDMERVRQDEKRHASESRVTALILKIDDELDDQGNRITRLEKNGH